MAKRQTLLLPTNGLTADRLEQYSFKIECRIFNDTLARVSVPDGYGTLRSNFKHITEYFYLISDDQFVLGKGHIVHGLGNYPGQLLFLTKPLKLNMDVVERRCDTLYFLKELPRFATPNGISLDKIMMKCY
jgi:hypothetical protein